jgi:hypothetical protein
VIQLLSEKIADVEGLVRAVVGLMALVMIIVVWVRTKSFVPTLGALLFGAFLIWGVNNVDFLEQKVGEEFQGMAPVPLSVVDGALRGG